MKSLRIFQSKITSYDKIILCLSLSIIIISLYCLSYILYNIYNTHVIFDISLLPRVRPRVTRVTDWSSPTTVFPLEVWVTEFCTGLSSTSFIFQEKNYFYIDDNFSGKIITMKNITLFFIVILNTKAPCKPYKLIDNENIWEDIENEFISM